MSLASSSSPTPAATPHRGRTASQPASGGSRATLAPASSIASTSDVVLARRSLLAAEALRRMTAGERKITQLFVVEEDGRPCGLLHIHDLLRAGIS